MEHLDLQPIISTLPVAEVVVASTLVLVLVVPVVVVQDKVLVQEIMELQTPEVAAVVARPEVLVDPVSFSSHIILHN